MEGEGHAVPIGRAQVLGPLVVKASAAVSSAAEMTAPSTSMADGNGVPLALHLTACCDQR